MKAQDPTKSPVYSATEIINGGFSIQTKFLPPTDFMGARVKAFRVDADRFGNRESICVGFHESSGCPHDHAVRAWIAKFRENQKPAKLFRGCVEKGYIYTFILEDLTK